jgi:hypothetical protein
MNFNAHEMTTIRYAIDRVARDETGPHVQMARLLRARLNMTTITVTQADIDAPRKPGDCATNSCPLARAIQRHVNGNVRVGLTTLTIYNRDLINNEEHDVGSPGWKIDLPHEAFRFRQAFDHCRGAKPFSFELPIPFQLLKPGDQNA